MIFALAFFLSLIITAYFYLTWNFDYWSKRGIPSAKPTILLGDLPNTLLRKEHVTSDFDKIYAKHKGKTPFVGIIQVRSPRLVIFEPELVKDVLIRNFKNFHDNEFGDVMDKEADPLFARNPFFLTGEEWKEKRAEIQPAFTASRLKALHPLIDAVQARMVNYLHQRLKLKEPLEARELCAKYTIDVVSNVIFGVDAQSFTEENPEIREMGRRLLAPSNIFIFKIFAVSALPILKRFVNIRFTTQDVEKFFTNLMEQALKYRKDNNVQREDFLDYLILLRNKKGIKSIDMAAHTISFFTDGFDTSSIAIAHVLYELGKNKPVQDKLRDEIEKHCDKDGKINFEKLNEISYLEQTFNETLRMHSSFISRRCTEEIELNFEGKKVLIEKDINVYIPIQQIHLDPEFYAEPEKFMPERFDPENGGLKAFKDKGVFLAFGDGPRICLGMRFALLQSMAGIAAIVKNFEISVNDKTAKKSRIDPREFVNVRLGGLWLDLKPVSLL